jgi:hypothetical protein
MPHSLCQSPSVKWLTEGLWLDGLVTVATWGRDKVLLGLLAEEAGAVLAGVGVPGAGGGGQA